MVNIWPSDGPLEVKFAAGGILVPFRGKHLVQIHFGVKRSSRPNIAKSKCFTCCNVCIVAIHVYETTVISIDLGSKSKQKGSLVCTCTLIWVSIVCFTDILLAHEEMQRVSALCSNKGNISQFYSVIVLTWKKNICLHWHQLRTYFKLAPLPCAVSEFRTWWHLTRWTTIKPIHECNIYSFLKKTLYAAKHGPFENYI